MSNPFFKNYGPFLVSDILKLINVEIDNVKKDFELKDIKDGLDSLINNIDSEYKSLKKEFNSLF